MRARATFALSLALWTACSSESPPSAPVDLDPPYDPRPQTPAWLSNAHVLVSGHAKDDVLDCRASICRHNENVDMTRFKDALFLVHRTARSQALGDNSALHVYRSGDGARTFSELATLPAVPGRDVRDPSLFVVGDTLYLKALTRLPVLSTRDTDVETVTMIATSADGHAWTPFEAVAPKGWSFWRVVPRGGTFYAAAYEDGDKSVVLYSSQDGVAWTKGALVYDVSADTPLETELVFMPSGRMLALVRTDGTDAELLGVSGRLRTQICWAMPPYDTFTCPSAFDGQRLDGPLAFTWNSRVFVVARKHIQDGTGRKRTSLFELTGTLDGGPLGIKEWGEIPSAGDTAYAGYAMIDGSHALIGWYSGDLFTDRPWVIAMFDLTDIWIGTIDLGKL